MIDIPVLVKELLRVDSTPKNFRVSFPNGEREDITNENIISESVTFTESICSRDTLKLGLCEASSIQFQMAGIGDIKGYTIQCSLEVDVSSIQSEAGLPSNWYSIPYGRFIVDSCKRSATNLERRTVIAYEDTFSAYDSNHKGDSKYVLRDFEKIKMRTPVQSKTAQYKMDIWKFILSNFNLKSIVKTYPLTQLDYQYMAEVLKGNMDILKPINNSYTPASYRNRKYRVSIYADYGITNFGRTDTYITEDYPMYVHNGLYYVPFTYNKNFDTHIETIYNNIVRDIVDNSGLYDTVGGYTYYRSDYYVNDGFTLENFKSLCNTIIKQKVDIFNYKSGTSEDFFYLNLNEPIDNTNVLYPRISGMFNNTNNDDRFRVYHPLELRIQVQWLPTGKFSSNTVVIYNDDTVPVRSGFNFYRVDLPDADGSYTFDREKIKFNTGGTKATGYNAESLITELLKDDGSKLRSYLQSAIELQGKFGKQNRLNGEFELFSIKDNFIYSYPNLPDSAQTNMTVLTSAPSDWSTSYLTYYRNVYTMLKTKPSDWSSNYRTYYRKSNNDYFINANSTWTSNKYYRRETSQFELITGVVPRFQNNMFYTGTLPNSLYPQDIIYPKGPVANFYKFMYKSVRWEDSPAALYGKIDCTYKDSEDSENTSINYIFNGVASYDLVTDKPDDWNNTYMSYYRNLYILTTARPSDWSTNYTSYYTFSSNTYKAVTGSSAPTWTANKYYQRIEGEYEPVKEGTVPTYADNMFYTALFTQDYKTYSLSDNALLRDCEWSDDTIQDILTVISDELKPVFYYPCELSAIGLPYLEAGDLIEVVTPVETFQTIVLRRTLKGVQSLTDTIEVR